MRKHGIIARCALAAIAGSVVGSAQADVTITIENMNEGGSFFFTPFWVAMHNGGFDSYDGGTSAAMWPGLTELAEGGNTGPISEAFALSPAGLAGGVDTTILASCFHGDAPVLNPGEAVSFRIDPGDRGVNRWFSYASMVIPSNDLFVANGNPVAHEVFNETGQFVGPFTIEILGGSVNDNGTEVNDAMGGAAFSANGGDSAPENELIRNLFSAAGDQEYLDSFIGSETVTGFSIDGSFGPATVVARITITLEAEATCPEDIDCNGVVDFADLLSLLASWGVCP